MIIRKLSMLVIIALCLSIVPIAAAASSAVTLNAISSVQSGGVVAVAGASTLDEVTIKVLRPSNSTVFYDIVKVTNGQFADSFTLGSNESAGTYTVVVGQANQVATTTFVVVAPSLPPTPTPLSSNADLSDLTLSSGTLSPAFTSGGTSYSTNVANDVSSITVTATASDSNATLKVNGTAIASGQVSGAISLNVGSNLINIEVTAQNGTPNTYTIVVSRAKQTYTVTFNSNGGSAVSSQPVNYNSTATKPSDPTRNGYTFGGWYKDSGLVTVFDFTTPITADTTLYAKWAVNNTSGPSGGGGAPATSSSNTVISTDGILTLPVGKSGEVSLDDEVKIVIPADAIVKDLQLTITKLTDTQKLLTSKDVPASPVFEILKNFSESFSNEITLIFAFDPKSVKENQKPSVFYYDEAKKAWVEVGGTVDGNHITVKVNHFTKYAVFAVDQTADSKAGTLQPVNFSDISGHWAEANIKQAVSAGIVSGYPDGTFKPDRTVTRAEFAVMLMNALKPQGDGAALTFTDKEKIGAWAQKSVAQAVYAGIISGYEDSSFRPDAEITRPEMAVMIAKATGQSIEANAATGFADDQDIPEWAKGAVATMKKLGIIEGKGANEFAPGDKTTRAEAVTVLLKMLAQKGK
ncbi:S-layer homology domain-containing protein [Paenibacillus rigui]|uniref:S-layer homology domain-containing protein n=1 Tax=Paenibacillus rigui TaxID=554312 RepID=UPI0015C68AA2|nr:S-layer homology domain-containing protein [Paenibacillus rigui]